jgi:hypothetical protein
MVCDPTQRNNGCRALVLIGVVMGPRRAGHHPREARREVVSSSRSEQVRRLQPLREKHHDHAWWPLH